MIIRETMLAYQFMFLLLLCTLYLIIVLSPCAGRGPPTTMSPPPPIGESPIFFNPAMIAFHQPQLAIFIDFWKVKD
jgi:hypothetical protein